MTAMMKQDVMTELNVSCDERIIELMQNDVLSFGGSCEAGGFCLAVCYSETFYKAWSGCTQVSSYADLYNLYDLWKTYGKYGKIVWLAKHEGQMPFDSVVSNMERNASAAHAELLLLNLKPNQTQIQTGWSI